MRNLKVLFVLFLMVSSTIFMSSCSKDEAADIRDNVAGTFNYNMKLYTLDGTTLTYFGSTYDETGTMIVKKNESNSTTIDFYEGGVLEFQGTKIASASNGLVFDIPSQQRTDDGVTYTMSGYSYWDLAGTKYHGAYLTANKKVQIAFQFNATIDNVQYTFVAVYEGTKQ